MSTHMCMGSKNISLRDEAYEALKSLQLLGESFSDTILRIKTKFGNFADVIGTGTLTEGEYDLEIKELDELRNKWR